MLYPLELGQTTHHTKLGKNEGNFTIQYHWITLNVHASKKQYNCCLKRTDSLCTNLTSKLTGTWANWLYTNRVWRLNNLTKDKNFIRESSKMQFAENTIYSSFLKIFYFFSILYLLTIRFSALDDYVTLIHQKIPSNFVL